MKVPRGIDTRATTGGGSAVYSGSSRSKRTGRRSISMDGSVNDCEEANEDHIIGPHDEVAPGTNRAYPSYGNASVVGQRHNSVRKSRSAAMVAMDGNVRSFDGSCGSTQRTPVVVRSTSSGSSGHGSFKDSESQTLVAADTSSAFDGVDDSVSFSSKDEGDECECCSFRTCIFCILGALILITSIALIAVFATRGDEASSQKDMAIMPTEGENNNGNAAGCHPFRIKDTMEPQLELHMTGLPRLMNDAEMEEVQRLILVEYNTVSGGCDDEFERWMYSVTMANQTLTHQVGLTAENDDGSTPAGGNDDTFTLVALFRTTISCNGCTSDSAFATEFPTSFGNATVVTGATRRLKSRDTPADTDESNGGSDVGEKLPSSPHLATGSRQLEDGLIILNAGQVMEAIEGAVVSRIEGIEAIVEAKVFSVSRGEIINTRKIASSGRSG